MILTVRSERAMERNFQGAKWLGNERAREQVGQGANLPESYWSICSGERIGPGAKRLGTFIRSMDKRKEIVVIRYNFTLVLEVN